MTAWKSGLFDVEAIKAEPPVDLACCLCCPCATSAMAQSLDDESPCVFNCCCMPLAASRRGIRKQYNIEGSWLWDMLTSCVCCCLASRQLMHEVKYRKGIEGPVDVAGIAKKSFNEVKDAAIAAKDDVAKPPAEVKAPE